MLTNPTAKRLAWIAKRYPAPVLYDTIKVFAAASARHGLLDDIHSARAGQRPALGPLTPELALNLARRGAPDTRYDRHLPWVAAVLNREHKRAMKVNRKIAAQMVHAASLSPVGVLLPYYDYMEQLATAKDTDEIHNALDAPSRDERAAKQREYTRVRDIVAPGKRGLGKYLRTSSKLEEKLVVIVDWAEAEGVDLTTYNELDDVIEQAETWAEERAELLDCDKVGPGEVVYCWPDGWTVQELLTTDELVCEGKILAHCARDYTVADLVVGGGDGRFFSLRDPAGKRVTTMMFDMTKANVPGHALRGFANRTPTVAELARMYEFRNVHPDLASRWVGIDAPALVKRSGSWEGRYQTLGLVAGRSVPFGEKVDVYGGAVYESEDVERAVDWIAENVGQSEYNSALEWLESADYEGEPMTEMERWEAAEAEGGRRTDEELENFDPGERSDYGLEVDQRSFRDQEEDAGDLAWVHYLLTGEELSAWDDGDEMADWMKEYRSMESPRTGFAFYGTKEPAIHLHSEGGRRIAYPFPSDADYGVVMRLVVDDFGSVPPHWRPERLHAAGSVDCIAATKGRLLS